MDLDNFFAEMMDLNKTPAGKAVKKVLELVEKGTPKEEAIVKIVCEFSKTKQQAEGFLDGVLKILKREHDWKYLDMLDVSRRIEEYFNKD